VFSTQEELWCLNALAFHLTSSYRFTVRGLIWMYSYSDSGGCVL